MFRPRGYPNELNSKALTEALKLVIESSRVGTDPELDLDVVRIVHRELFNNEGKSILYTYQIENKTDNDKEIKLYINKLALNFMPNTQEKINEACANLTGEKLAAFARQFQANLREAVIQNREDYDSAFPNPTPVLTPTTSDPNYVSRATITPPQPVTQVYSPNPQSHYQSLLITPAILSEELLVAGLGEVTKVGATLPMNQTSRNPEEQAIVDRHSKLSKFIDNPEVFNPNASIEQKLTYIGTIAECFLPETAQEIKNSFNNNNLSDEEFNRRALLLTENMKAAIEEARKRETISNTQQDENTLPKTTPVPTSATQGHPIYSPFPRRNQEVRRPADNNSSTIDPDANYTQFMPPSGQQNQYQESPTFQQPPKLPTRFTVARNESVRLSSWQTGTSAVSPTILHAQPKYSATQPIYQHLHQSNLRQPNAANLTLPDIKENLETAVSAHNVAYPADHKVEWNIKQNDRNKDQLIIEDTKKNNKEIATVEKIQDNVSYKFSDTITFDAADVILRASQDTEFTLDSVNVDDIENILKAANTSPHNEGENKKTITLSEKTLDFLRGQQNVPEIVQEKMEEQAAKQRPSPPITL